MPDRVPTELLVLAIGGVALGLVLLWRGLVGYRRSIRLGGIGTSRIATLAAGEVRVSGTVEPAEVTLVSPLQSAPCVWYRSRVRSSGSDSESDLLEEERGIGFRVRDATGSIRVFPRGAAFDVPTRFADRDGTLGDPPPGLNLRRGPVHGPAGEPDREAQIEALLTVRRPTAAGLGVRGVGALGIRAGRTRSYEEARLEPGDVVTIVGTAVPFGHLEDPAGADLLDRYRDPLAGLDDPEVAASIAEARRAGLLVTPEGAWGNAAIPGFGIGRPVAEPELDPRARPLPLATPEDAAEMARTFDLAPDLVVLAAAPGTPLLVVAGPPAVALGRQQDRFLLGLLGAVLAIGSAVLLAALLAGSLGT